LKDPQNRFYAICSGSLPLRLRAWCSHCIASRTDQWQILETASYAISLAYASRNHFPFSTYGENFFLTIQNVVITLLILYFSGQGVGADIKKPLSTTRGNSGKVVAGSAVATVTGFVLWSETLCPLGTRQ
jgi:hypothetical protein